MNDDSSVPSTSCANELSVNSTTDTHSPKPPTSPSDRTCSRLSPATSGSMESVAESSSSVTPSDYSTKASTYSEEWPRKEVPSAAHTSTISTTASPSTQRKPEGRMKIRTLCLLGALLPGIGCYICIFYTYLFQLDRVMNFTSTNCEEVKSPFPPVSYSIGVWKPQKYIWLTVLALHLPARMLYGLAYKSQYSYGQSTFKLMLWFPKIVKLHMRLLVGEALGLIMVSVIDIESSFLIHALCYTVWIICLNFNMLFNLILHHYSGIRQLTKHHDTTFYMKCVLFVVVYPLSISTGFSYFVYVWQCSGTAYATFSIAEYLIVGINSSFYFTLVWELRGSQLEFHINHGSHIVGELTI